MRSVVLSILVLMMNCCVQAQYTGYKLLKDTADFKLRFAAASRGINTVRSDFIQEKELAMLSEKIISRGKFFFRKEDAVRMEYTEPFSYLLVINGSKIYVKDSQKESKISSKSNKLFEQINKIMLNCVNGTALSSTDFTTQLFEGNDSYLAELSPVNKNLKTLFKHINLVVAKKDYAVTRIEMHEPAGDNTIIRFINREMNVTIPDALFAVK